MNFQPKLFLWLSLAFVVTTVAGTLLHESGHFLVGELLGYEAFLHYSHTSFANPGTISGPHYFLIVLGGVLLTLAIGTAGLAILYMGRRNLSPNRSLTPTQWFAVCLSLFWLRQLVNGMFGLLRFFRKGTFRSRGDESVIDRYLDWPYGTTLMPTALLAVAVLTFVCVKVIPRKQLPTFLLALTVGGSVGYYLWLVKVGRLLMP